MKKIRKTGILLLAVLILSGCGREQAKDEGILEQNVENVPILFDQASSGQQTDIVLVMDESGSMVKADKERMAIEGAKLFVDMEKAVGVQTALVEFSNQIKSTGLIDIAASENREYLKQTLDAVQYSSRAHTDTGAALLEAVSILDTAEETDNKVILLFTDGNTDIDADTPGRTTEDSLRDVDAAVQTAREKGYRIYCIGLNADGNVDEQEIANLSKQTGGQYRVAADVNELPEFFNAIFADIDQSGEQELAQYTADGDYHEVTFLVDNNSVLEANIVILSASQVEDVILCDPAENVVDMQNGELVTFTQSKRYSLVKLYRPQAGTWSIRVKGVAGDQIKIGLIYNYDVALAVEADKSKAVKGESIQLTAYLLSQEERLADPAIYRSLSGSWEAVDLQTGETLQGNMALSEEGNALAGTFTPEVCTTYRITLHMEGSGFYRDSEGFTVEVTKLPPTVAAQIGTVIVREGATKKLQLDDFFSDADGSGLIYSVSGTGNSAQVSIQDQVLEIVGVEKGESDWTILADNGSSETVSQSVHIRCVSFFQMYGKYILPAAGVLLVLAVFLAIKMRGERIYGGFQISFVSVKKSTYGTPETENYPIRTVMTADNLGRRGFTLGSLLKLAKNNYMDPDKKALFEEGIDAVLPEAYKIKVYGSKAAYQIRVINQSASARLIQQNILSERKQIVVSLNDKKLGVQSVMEKSFGARFPIDSEDYYQVNIKYQKM